MEKEQFFDEVLECIRAWAKGEVDKPLISVVRSLPSWRLANKYHKEDASLMVEAAEMALKNAYRAGESLHASRQETIMPEDPRTQAEYLLQICRQFCEQGERDYAFKIWPCLESVLEQIHDPVQYLASTLLAENFFRKYLLPESV